MKITKIGEAQIPEINTRNPKLIKKRGEGLSQTTGLKTYEPIASRTVRRPMRRLHHERSEDL